MPTENQIAKVLKDVTRKTVEGEIEWQKEQPPPALSRGTEMVVQDYFETLYKGQRLAVYELRYRAYDGESDSVLWHTTPKFGVIQDGDLGWDTAEDAPRIWLLLKVARESASDIENVFEALLSDD